MGGGISSLMPSGVTDVQEDWLELFFAMSFNAAEIKKLQKVFKFLDTDHVGTVSIGKGLSLLDVDRTKFNHKLFSFFDQSSGGRMDFYSFVAALWKFCTLESTGVCKY